jgi:hypothetical protein
VCCRGRKNKCANVAQSGYSYSLANDRVLMLAPTTTTVFRSSNRQQNLVIYLGPIINFGTMTIALILLKLIRTIAQSFNYTVRYHENINTNANNLFLIILCTLHFKFRSYNFKTQQNNLLQNEHVFIFQSFVFENFSRGDFNTITEYRLIS